MAVVHWIPLAYQTSFGFVLSLARLGDIRGGKKIYGSGFLPLALGSVCSGLSTGLWQIIAFRVLAGIGGAMVLANGRAILSIVYAQQERGRALGFASMAFHLGYISGPSVAGVFIDTVGWRWIFFLNLPVALAAAYTAWKVLPETPLQRQIHALDLRGMLTFVATAVTQILGLQQIAKSGVTWVSLVIFPGAAISAVLLVRFERTSPDPLLDLSLFRIRVLTAGVLSHLFVVISHSSTFFLLPFLPAGNFALFSDPSRRHGYFLFSGDRFLAPLGGWLGDRLGSRSLCTTGSALSLISMLGFSRLGSESNYISVMIPLMILGVGWSIFQAPN